MNSDASTTLQLKQASATIEFAFEYVHPDNLDLVRLERASAKLKQLPLTGNVRIVVTSQMARSLEPRIDPDYSAPFRRSRVSGLVTAKTVQDTSSSIEILVDAVTLLPDVKDHTEVTLGRLLEHEGIHLVLRQQGTDAHHIVRAWEEATGVKRDSADDALLWMAALALEEYRIERWLCTQGSFVKESYADEMPRILSDTFAAFAGIAETWGAEGHESGTAALELTSDVMTKVSFVAADHAVRQSIAVEVTDTRDWRALVGPAWPAMLEAGDCVPEALAELGDSPLEEGSVLRAAVDAFVVIAQGWCEHIGIRLEDDEGLAVTPLFLAGRD